MAMSPWRYPGGKARLSKRILEHIPDRQWDGYVEPFVGGGGFTFAALPLVAPGSPVLLNDADPRVAAWWQVMSGGEENFSRLLTMLEAYEPTVKSFYVHRDKGLKSGRLVERAFSAMVTNRCSFSGILSGGPIGGPQQLSQYDVGCRYNTQALVKKHKQVRELLSQFDVKVTSWDFREFLDTAAGTEGELWYLDPPYVRQGPSLYPTHFDRHDHDDLAKRVLDTKAYWAVSYDDDQYVHEKYAGEPVQILDIAARYTISAKKRFTSEVLILPAVE